MVGGGWGFDPAKSPCPVRGCPPLASLAATRVAEGRHGSGRKRKSGMLPDEYGRACPPPEIPGIRSKRRTLPPPPFLSGQTGRRARDRRRSGGELPGRPPSA